MAVAVPMLSKPVQELRPLVHATEKVPIDVAAAAFAEALKPQPTVLPVAPAAVPAKPTSNQTAPIASPTMSFDDFERLPEASQRKLFSEMRAEVVTAASKQVTDLAPTLIPTESHIVSGPIRLHVPVAVFSFEKRVHGNLWDRNFASSLGSSTTTLAPTLLRHGKHQPKAKPAGKVVAQPSEAAGKKHEKTAPRTQHQHPQPKAHRDDAAAEGVVASSHTRAKSVPPSSRPAASLPREEVAPTKRATTPVEAPELPAEEEPVEAQAEEPVVGGETAAPAAEPAAEEEEQEEEAPSAAEDDGAAESADELMIQHLDSEVDHFESQQRQASSKPIVVAAAASDTVAADDAGAPSDEGADADADKAPPPPPDAGTSEDSAGLEAGANDASMGTTEDAVAVEAEAQELPDSSVAPNSPSDTEG